MKKQKSYGVQTEGSLYLVPTPIGNLEDMSYRCINQLKNVAVIASEDTRNTKKLLNHFEITTPQLSFHEHNYKERIPQLLKRLKTGEDIAQVSDAGMPSISDPGHELVEACIEENIKVIALPGPTAGITALIASGLVPQPFTFYGFLPRKKNEQIKRLEVLKEQEGTVIFYESPYRIAATITNMVNLFGEDRKAVVCRELTKLHEEYLRGSLKELSVYLSENSLKGECCILVEGSYNTENREEELPDLSLREQVEWVMDSGVPSKEAIKKVAKIRNMKKQDVYKEYHEM